LAGAGLRVALCARRKDRLEGLAAELTARGHEATVHAVDVTDPLAVRAMVDDVATRWGRLDVLINGAGRGFAATLEQTTAEELRDLMELNVVAVLGVTRAVLPIMRRQGSGHIVNISSVVGRRAVPYRSAYSATKFALVALSEALRVELTGTGISVTLVYPIRTTETEFAEVEVQKVPWRPMGPVQSAERVARSILRCVRRPRPEVYPYWPVRILAVMSVLAPGLVDRGMRWVLQRSRGVSRPDRS
jgi:short-subunit dehydrogenase